MHSISSDCHYCIIHDLILSYTYDLILSYTYDLILLFTIESFYG